MSSIKNDLLRCMKKFENRCLTKSTQWCCDLLISMDGENQLTQNNLNGDIEEEIIEPWEMIKITFARQLFHQKEYVRAAYHMRNLNCNIGKFLMAYSFFKEYEKKRWEYYLKTEGIIKFDKNIKNIELNQLNEILLDIENPDSHVLYICALVHKRLLHNSSAIKVLIDAIEMDQYNWPAWVELAQLTTSYDKFIEIKNKLPDNWLKPLFVLESCENLNNHHPKDVAAAYEEVVANGLNNSNYVRLKMTTLNNLAGDLSMAETIYESIRKDDPFILEGVDLYSDLLFTQQNIVGLSKLVKELFSHSKYRAETCFAAGNLYNAAGLHSQSANYFRQTILLNPDWVHAWTLLGHEFIELRDMGSAVVCYRKALEMNPNEYRAWYGLGLVYELLKKPTDAVVMFERALTIRPNDPRILNAVATTCLKIGDNIRAKLILRRSIEVGDQDLSAAFTLAGLVAQTDKDEAAALYLQFLTKFDDIGSNKEENAAVATKYLMHYYFNTKQYQQAELYARRAARYNECLGDSEYILKQLDYITRTKNYNAPLPSRSKLFLGQVTSSDMTDSQGDSSDAMDLSFN